MQSLVRGLSVSVGAMRSSVVVMSPRSSHRSVTSSHLPMIWQPSGYEVTHPWSSEIGSVEIYRDSPLVLLVAPVAGICRAAACSPLTCATLGPDLGEGCNQNYNYAICNHAHDRSSKFLPLYRSHTTMIIISRRLQILETFTNFSSRKLQSASIVHRTLGHQQFPM